MKRFIYIMVGINFLLLILTFVSTSENKKDFVQYCKSKGYKIEDCRSEIEKINNTNSFKFVIK